MEDLRDRIWAIITQYGIQKMAVLKETITIDAKNDVDVFRKIEALKHELLSSKKSIIVTRD